MNTTTINDLLMLAEQFALDHGKMMIAASKTELRSALEEMVRALEAQEYDGHNVAWWHVQTQTYAAASNAAWTELSAAGVVPDGKKTLAEGVRELAARGDAAMRQLAMLLRSRTLLGEDDVSPLIDRLRVMGLL